MTEEKYIEELVGRRNPFRVPDQYFDHFADQMMQQLPERKARRKSIWLRPVFYAAASVCALVISVAVYLALPERGQSPVRQLAVQQEDVNTSFDEAADYMMLDNHDIYAYLSEN